MPAVLSLPTQGGRTQRNVAVGASAVSLAAASGNRKSVTIQNQGSGIVYLGGSSVTTSGATTGYALAAGATLTDNASNSPWYGISASGTNNVHVIEIA